MAEEEMEPQIINLSSYNLTEAQKKVLIKGLKFTPTPQYDQREIRSDIHEFGRKLRLKEFFHDKDTCDESVVRNKSSFTPDKGRNSHLDLYIEYLNKAPVGKQVRQNYRSNLNKQEREALNKLRENNDIIIKEADKGAAVVIMNKQYYEQKMLDILNDNRTYAKIDQNQDRYTLNQIKLLLDNLGDDFTGSEIDYITKFDFKASQFYGLPKIHKSQDIINKIHEDKSYYIHIVDPADLTFRPIVAGPACPTHRLSNLIDILLKPFVKHVKSFVRDDIDFLKFLPTVMSENDIFVSFDVTSLYSNISHELGLKAIKYWLDNFPDDIHERFSKQFILRSIKLILESNTFEFGSLHFKQVLGTAMGTKFAPSYATLVLAFLEIKLYKIVEEKYDTVYSEYIKNSFKRYLDDCFLIWDNSKGDICEFHSILNSLDNNINYTMEMNDSQLAFLDILVKRQDNKIITDIFYKATDTKTYLDFFSCHPRHIKLNVPYNLSRRICSIVTDQTLLSQRLNELKQTLLKRNYPTAVIEMGINRAKAIDVNTLRDSTKKDQENVLPFVETYNPNFESFFKTVTSNLPLLQANDRMGPALKDTRIINAKRQGPNLKRLLTRAKFTENDRVHKTSKCGNKRCKCCENIIETSSHFFNNVNMHFQIKYDMDCNTRNFIYVLFCNSCDASYVGQSGDELRSRTRVHRQHINNITHLSLPISRHIAECATNVYPKFKILPIYKMKTDNTQDRLNMEKHFMEKLKPTFNK